METLKEAIAEKYPKYAARFEELWKEAVGSPMKWENITKVRLQKLVSHLDTVLSPNSVRQYCAKLKAVLNLYSDEVNLPKGYEKILSPKAEKPVQVFLTESELDALIAYEPKSENEKLVKSQFLMGAFSGARHSDFLRFDQTNIVGENLEYVSQKTKMRSVVPCKPIVAQLILSTEKRTLPDKTFNEILRRICKAAGIVSQVKVFKAGEEKTGQKWEFVSSHTARRSFATNLYLKGLDIYTISRFLGHSSVEMTAQNYICAEIRELSDEVKKYFE